MSSSPTAADLMGFLRCGFAFSELDSWLASPPETRHLLTTAAENLDMDRAANIGYASLSELHAAHIRSVADGGKSLRRLALQSAAVDVARKAVAG